MLGFKFIKHIGPGQSRELGPIARTLSRLISLSTAVLFITVAAGVYVEQYIALYLFMAAVLSLAFLHQTGNCFRPRQTTIFSGGLTALSLLCCGYMVYSFERLSQRLPTLDPLTNMDIGVSILLILLVLEATRRCAAPRAPVR